MSEPPLWPCGWETNIEGVMSLQPEQLTSKEQPPPEEVSDLCNARARRATLPIASLLPGDCLRLSGTDKAHVKRLAEAWGELPPIVVHWPTMRVIDGMHRVRAAVHNGKEQIEAEFFDGSVEAAFVRAVELNTAHGLPLTLAERKLATAR